VEVKLLLYLVQHAEARREEEDPARPLSEKGVNDTGMIVSHLSRLDIRVDRILHSGKLRAKQTAEVLASGLRPLDGVSEADGLLPLDDPERIARRLSDVQGSLMLVGHLPHLGKLASLLLCGDPGSNAVSFRMAGVLCLERDEKGLWSVKWMLTPEVVR
jgi:phosphohistidine phosphatase